MSTTRVQYIVTPGITTFVSTLKKEHLVDSIQKSDVTNGVKEG